MSSSGVVADMSLAGQVAASALAFAGMNDPSCVESWVHPATATWALARATDMAFDQAVFVCFWS